MLVKFKICSIKIKLILAITDNWSMINDKYTKINNTPLKHNVIVTNLYTFTMTIKWIIISVKMNISIDKMNFYRDTNKYSNVWHSQRPHTKPGGYKLLSLFEIGNRQYNLALNQSNILPQEELKLKFYQIEHKIRPLYCCLPNFKFKSYKSQLHRNA